jgi:hypothetical protein
MNRCKGVKANHHWRNLCARNENSLQQTAPNVKQREEKWAETVAPRFRSAHVSRVRHIFGANDFVELLSCEVAER